MPSQIKVDEIKNVAGQYKIKTNVLEGQTTAGSISVQDQGTATTNLQQGLCKSWIHFNGTVTVAIKESLNISSLTDVNTGEYKTIFTNNKDSTLFCADSSSRGDGSNNNNRTAACKITATSEVEFSSFVCSSGNAEDLAQNFGHTMGTLA